MTLREGDIATVVEVRKGIVMGGGDEPGYYIYFPKEGYQEWIQSDRIEECNAKKDALADEAAKE
jgi:hypothetical protein